VPKRALAKAGEKAGGRRSARRDVEILATLLVAYPQVSRVTFDPEKKTLGLVFLCQGPIGSRRRAALSRAYKDSVEVYLRLSSRTASVLNASWEKMGDFYCFQIERDVASLSPEELNVAVDLVSERARPVPAGDEVEMPDSSEECAWPARLFLQEMLEQVKDLQGSRKLVALREGERVLVFDK
jgi:hypothetical protein